MFSSMMPPDSDEVKYAAEHFSVALSSLKIVSYTDDDDFDDLDLSY